MLWISARSCAMWGSLPAAIASPAMPTTKVLPRCMWMYGATDRNHGTKVKLKIADIGRSAGGTRQCKGQGLRFPLSSRHGSHRGRLLGRVLRDGGADDGALPRHVRAVRQAGGADGGAGRAAFRG